MSCSQWEAGPALPLWSQDLFSHPLQVVRGKGRGHCSLMNDSHHMVTALMPPGLAYLQSHQEGPLCCAAWVRCSANSSTFMSLGPALPLTVGRERCVNPLPTLPYCRWGVGSDLPLTFTRGISPAHPSTGQLYRVAQVRSLQVLQPKIGRLSFPTLVTQGQAFPVCYMW